MPYGMGPLPSLDRVLGEAPFVIQTTLGGPITGTKPHLQRNNISTSGVKVTVVLLIPNFSNISL